MIEQRITHVIEEIDLLSHEVREVYAVYGLCMYLSHGLERIMATLLAGCYFDRPKRMTTAKYDKRLEAAFNRTFGSTVNEWCKHETDVSFSMRLRKAAKTRNWLTHHYFWERAGHFVLEEGIEFMQNELRAIRDEFEEIDAILTAKALELNGRLGVPASHLEESAERARTAALNHIVAADM